jgi:hypothetical protein
MSPVVLDIAVLIAAGAVLVLVPLLILLLASRIRNAAHESTQHALAQTTRQHDEALGEFTRQYDRALAESIRQHDRAVGEYARQHERALAELAAEHRRIAQEFGMFSQKRHEVYARLYARYRRATRGLSALLTEQEPQFQKFSRDDLLRYLRSRNVRERDAADAIGAMDRGDVYAMNRLMSKLHWSVSLRDATTGFERAREFEMLNELYLSDAVREAVGNLRRKVDALVAMLAREQDRGDQVSRNTRQDELQVAVGSLLHAMREDLRAPGTEAKPKPRPELDRSPHRAALPASAGLADKVSTAPRGAHQGTPRDDDRNRSGHSQLTAGR